MSEFYHYAILLHAIYIYSIYEEIKIPSKSLPNVYVLIACHVCLVYFSFCLFFLFVFHVIYIYMLKAIIFRFHVKLFMVFH